MKATGVVRRIDDLGRIVIPKEIRRTLRIREGDPLEIFTDKQGEIILKKYSAIGDLGSFVKEYAESLNKTSGHLTCIIDKDRIVAASGTDKKEFLEKSISAELIEALNQRQTVLANRNDESFIPIIEDEDGLKYNNEIITPIISEGDVLGAIVLLSPDKQMGEIESKLSHAAAGFFGRQMES